mgnify:FL=1
MFVELRELLRSGAIRRHQLGSIGILTPLIYGNTDMENASTGKQNHYKKL